jgi:hypothetical protein
MTDKKNGTQGAGPAAATETAPKRKKLSKVEAVRRAMAALGAGACPSRKCRCGRLAPTRASSVLANCQRRKFGAHSKRRIQS